MSIDNIADISPRIQYVATAAQTDFDYPFPIFKDTDLVVDVDGVTQAITTDYTVSGEGEDNGGTVTFVTPMTGNEVVTIYRDMAIERLTDFQQNGPYSSASLNDDLDRITLVLQDLKAGQERSLRFPVTAELDASDTLFSPIANWKGKFLKFNSTTALPEPSDIITTTLSQSTIGENLYPQTTAEAANGITPTNYHLPPGYVERYGNNSTPGTTDMTVAFNRARTVAAASGVVLQLPPNAIVLVDEPTAIAGQVTVRGYGPFKSRITFRPTANNKAAIKVSNGVSRAERVLLQDFSIWSDDSTYTKIGLDLYDLSVCELKNIFIFGTGGSGPSAGACWSGNSNTSIGIRTHGRDACSVKNVEVIADRPIVIAANPNTAATDGEDMDHWNWENLYLVGNGNYLIEVDAGLGLMETEFGGYQAWVGGTGGFKINDTRVAPTVPSRGINFRNVRHEQITDSAGYSFNMAFTQPIQNISFERVLMAAGGHGITINGFDRFVLDRVTAAMASGKNSIVTAGVTSKSVLAMRGCIWQSGSNVTLTGLTQILAGAYRSADYAGPSDAIYAGQITDTAINVELLKATATNGATGLRVTGTTGDRFDVNPQAAGSGVQLRSENNAGTDYEPAAMYVETLDVRTRTGAATVASAFQVDANNTAGNTRLLLYDVDNATVERVSVGAADSGGAGFKVLRIPN